MRPLYGDNIQYTSGLAPLLSERLAMLTTSELREDLTRISHKDLIQQPTGVRAADLDHREAEIASARHTDIAWFVDAVGLSKNEWPGRPQTDSAAQLLERLAEEVL